MAPVAKVVSLAACFLKRATLFTSKWTLAPAEPSGNHEGAAAVVFRLHAQVLIPVLVLILILIPILVLLSD